MTDQYEQAFAMATGFDISQDRDCEKRARQERYLRRQNIKSDRLERG